MKKNIDLGLLILRVTVSFMMLLHGVAKLNEVSGIKSMLEKNGLPIILSYGVYITEIIAPIMMIIGFRTRLFSAVFTFGALFALFLAHSDQILSLSDKGGWAVELLGLYIFSSLALIFTGGGNYSISCKNNWD